MKLVTLPQGSETWDLKLNGEQFHNCSDPKEWHITELTKLCSLTLFASIQ